MTIDETAARLVGRIIDDLSDRRGLRQEWEAIDEDIQSQIVTRWIVLAVEDICTLVNDTPVEEAKPLDELTGPGWYELDDRCWQEFTVAEIDGPIGRLVGGRVVASFDEVMELRAEDQAVVARTDPMKPMVLGGRMHNYEPEPADQVLEYDTTGPADDDITCLPTLIRHRTHDCEVRAIHNATQGFQRYEIGYRDTRGQMNCMTGEHWSNDRHKALARLRAIVKAGDVAVRS